MRAMLSVVLEERRVPLVSPVRNARGQWSERVLLQVRVRAAGGEAVGEAAPLPGHTADTLDAARKTLREMSWDGLGPLLDEPKALLAELARRTKGSASARFAVQSALLSLVAARREVPLAGVMAELLGTRPAPFEVAAWIEGDDAEALLAGGRRAVEQGHRTLKFKVGRDLDRELATARALRRAVGDAVRLRFDANGALGEGSGVDFLRALASLRPELVEEPGPPAFVDAAAALVPVGLDESLTVRSAPEVEALLARGVVRALVLKPMALGLGACLHWCRFAARYDVPVIVSHLLGGPREMDVAESLAAAAGGPLAHGLGHHRVLAALKEPPRPARRRPRGPPWA